MKIGFGLILIYGTFLWAGSPPLRVIRVGAPAVVLTEVTWEEGLLQGTVIPEKTPQAIPVHQIDRLMVSPSGEKALSHVENQIFTERNNYRYSVSPLPARFQMEGVFTVGGKLNMVLTPVVVPGGSAEPRSLRLTMQSDKVWVQGSGGGRNMLQTFQRVEGSYPKPFPKEMHVRFFMDRKTGKAVLRMNGVVVGAVRMPGGTGTPNEKDREMMVVPRSGFPQSISFLQIYDWTHNATPEAEVKAGKKQDAVWLQNGDVLACRVLSIREGKVHLRLEGDVEIPLPLERVLEIALYRRPAPKPETTPGSPAE